MKTSLLTVGFGTGTQPWVGFQYLVPFSCWVNDGLKLFMLTVACEPTSKDCHWVRMVCKIGNSCPALMVIVLPLTVAETETPGVVPGKTVMPEGRASTAGGAAKLPTQPR